MDGDKNTQKTKVIVREDINSAAGSEKDRTRVYDIPEKETIIVSGHKWISDDDEDVIKPVGRTRVGLDSNTRLYEKQPAGSVPDEKESSEKKSFREVMDGVAGFTRGVYADLRNVRVGDSEKFARFLKVIGVFAVILLLEIGYFMLAHRTERMPEEIKETQKELELTQKETVILQEEIDALGGYDSIEEQKQSWERLKEKVEKAAAETSY